MIHAGEVAENPGSKRLHFVDAAGKPMEIGGVYRKPYVTQIRERINKRREYERRKTEIGQSSRPGARASVSQITLNDERSESEVECDPSIFHYEAAASAVQDPKAFAAKAAPVVSAKPERSVRRSSNSEHDEARAVGSARTRGTAAAKAYPYAYS